MSAPRAAVDCGSNSTRLLVVDADGNVLDRRLRITRLSQGVDATGRLDREALQRTLRVIAEYRDRWQELGVATAVRIAATSAVRDADNRDDFFAGVRELTGVDAEVLSGDEEAALSFHGAVGALDLTGNVAVLDIGGGSTELVVGTAAGPVAGAFSMQLGSVRVTERHLADDPAHAAQIDAARAMADQAMDEADRQLSAQGADVDAATTTLVGVAGTVTTVAALCLDLDEYDPEQVHGTTLSAADVTAWTRRLLSMTSAQRGDLAMVQPGREDVIHGGALILDEVMQRYGFGSVIVSEADILDGLAASM